MYARLNNASPRLVKTLNVVYFYGFTLSETIHPKKEKNPFYLLQYFNTIGYYKFYLNNKVVDKI